MSEGIKTSHANLLQGNLGQTALIIVSDAKEIYDGWGDRKSSRS